MKRFSLRDIIFIALCSDLGIICKKLISPAAKVVTESLHIPGGISTAFSLAFVVIGAMLVERFGTATIISFIQWGTALAIGSVGNLGLLAIVAYLVPGLIIDVTLFFAGKKGLGSVPQAVVSCALAGLSSCLVSNMLMFHLTYPVILLYGVIAITAGALGGAFAAFVFKRIKAFYSGVKAAK